MATSPPSAHDIRSAAQGAAAAVLPLEIASTLPVPVRAGGGLQALVIYYRETGSPNRRTVHPPSHAMWLDAATARVLRFSAVTPEALGISMPPPPVPGVGIDPAMTIDDFMKKRARFLDISRDVWAAFEAGGASPGAAVAATVQEYWALFQRITKAEVAPFYVGAARPFFDWVRAVAGVP